MDEPIQTWSGYLLSLTHLPVSPKQLHTVTLPCLEHMIIYSVHVYIAGRICLKFFRATVGQGHYNRGSTVCVYNCLLVSDWSVNSDKKKTNALGVSICWVQIGHPIACLLHVELSTDLYFIILYEYQEGKAYQQQQQIPIKWKKLHNISPFHCFEWNC